MVLQDLQDKLEVKENEELKEPWDHLAERGVRDHLDPVDLWDPWGSDSQVIRDLWDHLGPLDHRDQPDNLANPALRDILEWLA